MTDKKDLKKLNELKDEKFYLKEKIKTLKKKKKGSKKK